MGNSQLREGQSEPQGCTAQEVGKVPSLGRSDGTLEGFTVPSTSWKQNLSTETSLQHPLSPADRILESCNSRIQLARLLAPCLPTAPLLPSFCLHASSNGKLTTWAVQLRRRCLFAQACSQFWVPAQMAGKLILDGPCQGLLSCGTWVTAPWLGRG